MSEYKAARDHSRCPSHPGEVIDDILADFRIFKSDIAESIGISRQHLHQIIACRRPLSPEVAVRVAALLSGSEQNSGCGCRLLMMHGMPLAAWTYLG